MDPVLRILHLEDDPVDAELVTDLLADEGIAAQVDRVDRLADYQEALARGGYALILSDYSMPALDPQEALALARRIRPELPFIFLSGTLGEDLAIETLKSGADDYVLKQRMERFVPAVRRALREAEDRAARKQAEEALQASEERLRMALSAGAMGWWQWDPSSGKVVADANAKALFGLPSDAEASLELFLKYLTPDEVARVFREIPKTLASPGEFESEFRLTWPDGSTHWVLGRGRALRDGQGKPTATGVIMDITARKRAEEALTAAKQCAEQANRAKDHFLAVLSHELRTPLTPVQMGISILQNRNPDPALGETLDMMRRHIEMEARLIDDLLDVTRIARGKIELNRSPVELGSIIQRAVEICRPDIDARGLKFGVAMGWDEPYWVDADAGRLQQVLWNLLKNAIKFTPHGGCVGIRVQKDDGSRRKDEGLKRKGEGDPSSFILIEVADSGIGIESEALARIFNAFEQAEQSITQRFGGLGLGLAISKAIVELHDGSIEAQSEGRGKGATFLVRLPLCPPAEPTGPSMPGTPHVRGRRSLRILLVEDHGMTAKMMRWVLVEDGHQVKTAGDVATALELAKQNGFDLLISDLGLPDATGHDLMRELRQRGHAFPAIALSGYGQEQDIQQSREAGFAAHMVKPASRERLLETVAAVTAGPAVEGVAGSS